MIDGGNAAIYVSDMDQSIKFFTESLGLSLRLRIEDEWAEIDAGKGMVIGLHPARPPETVTPGTRGAIDIELNVTEPIDSVVDTLKKRGVVFDGPVKEYENVKVVTFKDPDANTIVLAEVLNSEL